MDICWENLDKLHLTKNGNFCTDSSRIYIYNVACRGCGKPFLAANKTIKYCCYSCANTGKNNPRYGKPHTEESKQKMSEIAIGKFVGEKAPNWKGGVKKLNIPLYDTYAPQFPSNFEETRVIMVGEIKALGVRCHNSGCRKWFVPKLSDVKNRRQVFYGKLSGDRGLYCSKQCKQVCSTYKQILYPKGQNPNKKGISYTSAEYELYRTTVMERENYLCEFCGDVATDVHHEKSQKTDPMFSLDPDYGHACCEKCHMRYGHKIGTECSIGNLAKKIC